MSSGIPRGQRAGTHGGLVTGAGAESVGSGTYGPTVRRSVGVRRTGPRRGRVAERRAAVNETAWTGSAMPERRAARGLRAAWRRLGDVSVAEAAPGRHTFCRRRRGQLGPWIPTELARLAV